MIAQECQNIGTKFDGPGAPGQAGEQSACGHSADMGMAADTGRHSGMHGTSMNAALNLAAPQGFEPRYADPESAVLPLNEGAVIIGWSQPITGPF